MNMLDDVKEGIVFRNWWVIAIKGLLAIFLGIATVFSQNMGGLRFVNYFAYLLLGLGILGVYIGVYNMVKSSSWSLWIVEGLASVLLSIIIFQKKLLVNAYLLDLMVGLWLLVVCIQPVVFLFRYYKSARNFYILTYNILFILFALLMLFGFILSFFRSGAIYGNIPPFIIAGALVAIYGAFTLVLSIQYRRLPL